MQLIISKTKIQKTRQNGKKVIGNNKKVIHKANTSKNRRHLYNLGGAVSLRTVALQHVSFRNIKFRLFMVIKSLIRNYLFLSERMLKNANLMALF